MLTGASDQDDEGTAAGTSSLIEQIEPDRPLSSTAQTEVEPMKHRKQHFKLCTRKSLQLLLKIEEILE